MRSIKVYDVYELKEKFPEAFEKAHENFKDDVRNDTFLPWQEEIMDSLKATFKNAGVTLHSWSIGAYYYHVL